MEKATCIINRLHVCMLSHFNWVQLFATLWTVACQVPLSQTRILEWVAMPSSKGSSYSVQFSSVTQFSLKHRGLQHGRPPCPSPTPRVYSNSCPLSQWCHPTISFPVVPFFSCLQSFPVSGSFQMGQLFASGGQCIGVSASTLVLPKNTQDWSPLGWTDWISL